jgi:hypothetical protein
MAPPRPPVWRRLLVRVLPIVEVELGQAGFSEFVVLVGVDVAASTGSLAGYHVGRRGSVVRRYLDRVGWTAASSS